MRQGSDTGFAAVQAAHTRGRASCAANETDRRCALRLLSGAPAHLGGADVSLWRGWRWGNGFNATVLNRRLCLLSIDGNSFASNFAYALLRAQAPLQAAAGRCRPP